MADKAISELVAAEQITATDMFVLEQNNTAKKLTGQILLNWLTKAADGHGGIQSIVKQSTSGLVDTYRITLADETTFDFPVTNGKSITGITKSGSSGLTDTYEISYNDSTSSTFSVTNGRGIKSWTESVAGLVHTITVTYDDDTVSTFQIKDGAKGDKGDNAYLWIKYASQEPTPSSHSMSDIPDDWIGVYSGNSSTAPTDYTQYKWFQYKGEKGNKGDPATIQSQAVAYQVSDSGTIIPSGVWSASVPVVAQGKYLWTRTTVSFNSGNPVVSYSVSRMGLDGSGSVSSVAGISPNPDGNVPLTATHVGALPSSGGDLTGELKMNGQPISGLNPPTENTQATNKWYVDTSSRKASPYNLLDNSDFRNPVNQRGQSSYTGSGYTIDRWETWEANRITIGNGYINTGDDIFWQRLPENAIDDNKKYTAALCTASGSKYVYSGTASAGLGSFGNTLWFEKNDTKWLFRIEAGMTENIAWVALYEGEYTADTLPEYQPKGYGAELAECQRYYQVRTTNNIAAADMRPTMRLSSPTIMAADSGYAYSADL